MINQKKSKKWLWIVPGVFVLFYMIGQLGKSMVSSDSEEKEEVSFWQRGIDETIGLPYEIRDIKDTKEYSPFLSVIDDAIDPVAGGIFFPPLIIENPVGKKDTAKIIFYVDRYSDKKIYEDIPKEVTFTIDMVKSSFDLFYDDKYERTTMIKASPREIAELLVKLGEGSRVFISIERNNGGLTEDQKKGLKSVGEAWLKHFSS